MNNKNLLSLINVIRDEDNFFSMASWTIHPLEIENPVHFKNRYGQEPPKCGTASCIGGWTDHLMKKPNAEDYEEAAWLGITVEQFNALCFPKHRQDYYNIARQDAIDVLENLYLTGEVDWNAGKE